MINISKISANDLSIDVFWSDGEKSNFNYLWLRDNCPTAHDKDSRHRMFNILEVSTRIKAKNCQINDDGKLVIEWSEGNHTSYFDPKWLRENCYTLKNKQKYISPYILWDSSLQNNLDSICIEHEEIISSDNSELINYAKLRSKDFTIEKITQEYQKVLTH
mgnify:CR=1 FL=1